jgi:hypothetical protein
MLVLNFNGRNLIAITVSLLGKNAFNDKKFQKYDLLKIKSLFQPKHRIKKLCSAFAFSIEASSKRIVCNC